MATDSSVAFSFAVSESFIGRIVPAFTTFSFFFLEGSRCHAAKALAVWIAAIIARTPVFVVHEAALAFHRIAIR